MRRRRRRRRRRRPTPRRRRFTCWKRFSGGRRITRRRGKVGQGRRRGKRGDAEGEEEKREEKELKNFCRNLTVPAALELSASGRKLNQWDEARKVLGSFGENACFGHAALGAEDSINGMKEERC